LSSQVAPPLGLCFKIFKKGLASTGKSAAYSHRRNIQSPRGAIRRGLFY
jgi:hypothetical protein